MSYKRFMPINLLDSHSFLGCTGQALSSLFTIVKTEVQRGKEPWSKSHIALGSKAWMRGHVLGLLAQSFFLLSCLALRNYPTHTLTAGLLYCPSEAFLEWLWKRRTGERLFYLWLWTFLDERLEESWLQQEFFSPLFYSQTHHLQSHLRTRCPEKEMATHSGILAWKIPWTEEPAGYSPWGFKRVGHHLATKQPPSIHSPSIVRGNLCYSFGVMLNNLFVNMWIQSTNWFALGASEASSLRNSQVSLGEAWSQVKKSPRGQGQRGQNHERVIFEQMPRMETEPKGAQHPSPSCGHCGRFLRVTGPLASSPSKWLLSTAFCENSLNGVSVS